MLTFDEIEQFALVKMKNYLKRDWRFEFSEKMENSFGLCYSSKIIRLSSKYIRLNLNFFHIIKDVILHEIAHAIQFEKQGYLSHDKHWKLICSQIGAKPRRLYTPKDLTCPCELWALRDAITGEVLGYSKEDLRSVAEEFTDSEIRLESVWCGN